MDFVTALADGGATLVDVQVEAYAGRTGTGDTWSAQVTYSAYVEARRRLVRNAEGSEVVSETTVWILPGATIPPRSKITLPGGRVTRVITVSEFSLRDGADVFDHRELACE